MSALYQVAAQGRFMTKLGRTCFRLAEAEAMAADLRKRGYADAHAQLYVPGRPLPPFLLMVWGLLKSHGRADYP